MKDYDLYVGDDIIKMNNHDLYVGDEVICMKCGHKWILTKSTSSGRNCSKCSHRNFYKKEWFE